jgi:hypothetical protein
MDEIELDIHSRVMLKGNEYPSPTLTDWIALPDWAVNLPAGARRQLSTWCYKNPDLVEVKLALVDRVDNTVKTIIIPTATGVFWDNTDPWESGSKVNKQGSSKMDPKYDDDGREQTTLLPTEHANIDFALRSAVTRAYPRSISEDVEGLVEDIYADCLVVDIQSTPLKAKPPVDKTIDVTPEEETTDDISY